MEFIIDDKDHVFNFTKKPNKTKEELEKERIEILERTNPKQ